jgi:PIN domain nuclease of toxin-antitoxin system
LPDAADFPTVAEVLGLVLLDTPSELWRIAALLPDIHRDPMDCILIAHAIHADLTLVTADAKMRSYPVRTIW